MSGGYFDYDQYRINDIVERIEHVIVTNDDKTLTEWGDTKGHNYKPEIIDKFKEAIYYLQIAQIYAQRTDWLLSGDDGEDTFLERLKEDLNKLRNQEKGEGNGKELCLDD